MLTVDCINHFEMNTEILPSIMRTNERSITHLLASFVYFPRALTPISPANHVHQQAVRQLPGSRT